jgi:hypothetical protein
MVNAKAFEVLDAMRAAVRNDPRPCFQDLEVPEVGPCRLRRYQPEVLMVLRGEAAACRLAEKISDLEHDDPARLVALRLVQRALVPVDRAGLLFPGDEALARLTASLPTDRLASVTQQLIAFQEF